ncbi:MAG: DUF2520 domain-containing protein [Solirubrobacterales bacterium]
MPRLAIVGRGRVGGAVAAAAKRAALPHALAGRGNVAEACAGADAALLCVGDADIHEAAQAAGAARPAPRLIGHTSGATDLDVLSGQAEAAFSLHPLQTIPGPGADLTGAPCAVAGSTADALAFAGELAGSLGMVPFEVPEAHRAAYHAGASMASNFLVALEESAAELLERAGVPNPRSLLAPLVLRSAANWAEHGSQALTGPIARGDEATVSRHIEALQRLGPELLPLYQALAERTREVARGR